jgi:hypothetical protein
MKKKIEEQWKNTFTQSLGISRSQDSSESNRFQPERMNSTNSYNLEPRQHCSYKAATYVLKSQVSRSTCHVSRSREAIYQ